MIVWISGAGGADAWIGSDREAEPWHGVIDEMRIYDRALSAQEMQALVPGYGANKVLIGMSPCKRIRSRRRGSSLMR